MLLSIDQNYLQARAPGHAVSFDSPSYSRDTHFEAGERSVEP